MSQRGVAGLVTRLGRNFMFVCAAAMASDAALAQDPAYDDFERPALGPNWGIVIASTAIVNQSDLGTSSTSGCVGGWTASTFQADQFSEAQISSDTDPLMLEQVFVRRRASDGARYGFHWNGDPGMSRWEIKYDGVPSAQTVILANVNGPGPSPGDTLRIEVNGTNPITLRGYHNGQLELVGSHSAPNRIVTTGPAGVVARMPIGQTNAPPTPIFEWWAGGSLAQVETYCMPQHNSLNCVPNIGWSGSPSASASSGYLITATNELNNKAGLLFYGKTGATSAPFGLGTLCVTAPLRRTPVQVSGGSPTGNDCTGSFALDFNAWIASGVDPALVVGQEVWAQYYSRDAGIPPPNSTNVTNGLHFTLAP